MTTQFATRGAAPQAAAAPATRLDLYGPIHKALRALLADTLQRVARLDVEDEAEVTATAAQLDDMLFILRSHLEHENDFMHTAIEARRPGGAQRTVEDHREHEEALESLADEVGALRCRTGEGRQLAADRLHRHLGLFFAENLQHMHVEETANQQALWAHYTDAELHAIHGSLLATLTERERSLAMRWMLPALNPAERAGMLRGMRAQMPAEAFTGFLGMVQGLLDAGAWRKLQRDLGLPAA